MSELKFIYHILILAVLWYVAQEDAKTHLIPNHCVYALLLLAMISPFPSLGVRLITGAAIFLFLLFFTLTLEAVIKKPAMGGGDIKLYGVLGAALPLGDILMLILISQGLAALWLL